MKLPRAHLRVIEPGPGPNGEPPRSLAGRTNLPEQLREAERPWWRRALGWAFLKLTGGGAQMITAGLVAAWLLGHPAYIDRDLPPEVRAPLVQVYAEAIVEETRDPVQIGMLLGQGWGDTKFAHLVLSNRCQEMPAGQRCDNGRARGAFGMHQDTCPAAFLFPATSRESIRAETHCALGALWFHGKRCGKHALSFLFGAYSGMAGGGRCNWDRAGERVLVARNAGEWLRRAEARR